MKKNDNKGFSLVELIIVIAIMVVLVIAIAPQYLKFVNNSRISTDVQTAQAMVTAIDAAVADQKKPFASPDAIGFKISLVDGIDAVPASKLSGTWKVYGSDVTGVSFITLEVDSKVYQVFPNPDATAATTTPATTVGGINDTTLGLKK